MRAFTRPVALLIAFALVLHSAPSAARTPRATRNLGMGLTISGLALLAVGSVLIGVMFAPGDPAGAGPNAAPVIGLGVGVPLVALGSAFTIAGPILWHRGDVQLQATASGLRLAF